MDLLKSRRRKHGGGNESTEIKKKTRIIVVACTAEGKKDVASNTVVECIQGEKR
jgi:hypothetical protein